jgi:mono/diheme cytochrome c family protein
MRTVLVVMAAALGLGLTFEPQAPVPGEYPLMVKSTVGAELFKYYCSTCHGNDAKGRPAATPARPAAPDLTDLARREGGVFPRDQVVEVIRHGSGSLAAHGAAGMPVWGAIFRGSDPNDTRAEIRIINLVEYLQSLQDQPLGSKH